MPPSCGRPIAVQSGKVRRIDIPDAYRVTNIIPVCPMSEDKAASEYMTYLMGDEGKVIFEKHGLW